jgi:hypothetical protein
MTILLLLFFNSCLQSWKWFEKLFSACCKKNRDGEEECTDRIFLWVRLRFGVIVSPIACNLDRELLKSP